MQTIDFVTLALLGLALGLAIWKIVQDKKRGRICCGCQGCCKSCAVRIPKREQKRS